jgi:hypothetical protein
MGQKLLELNNERRTHQAPRKKQKRYRILFYPRHAVRNDKKILYKRKL